MAVSSVSSAPDPVDIFKEVYGDGYDLTTNDQYLSKVIPFSQKDKVGESFKEAVVLTAETGITLSGSTSAFVINDARAGTVEQATVSPYVSVLSSIIPWTTMSRSAGAGKKAFFDATKFLVKNNLKSHDKVQEVLRLYGQSDGLLGYVSYFTGTYRGVSFTNGTGTLNGISFTNGRSADLGGGTYALLLAPGSFASGIWVNMEGMALEEFDENDALVASLTLTKVNSEYGYIIVQGSASAPSALDGGATTSNRRLAYKGMGGSSVNTYVGVNKILSISSGNLFGIPVADYSLWQGAKLDLENNSALSLSALNTVVANMVNQSGMDGDLVVLVNPRTWGTLSNNDAALRVYDQSYSPKRDENGFESIEYYSQAGKMSIHPHRCVKEGEAYGLHLPSWSRSGSADVSFKVPGLPQDVIFPLEGQAGYMMRSFSDQYIFTHAPAQNFVITGINDELAGV